MDANNRPTARTCDSADGPVQRESLLLLRAPTSSKVGATVQAEVGVEGANTQNPGRMSVIAIFRQRSATTPLTGFQASLLIKLEKLDWGSILDNKSDGHAR